MNPLLLTLLAICITAILMAAIVAALRVADVLEVRRRRRAQQRYQELTTFQQSMERILEEQPY